MRLFPVMTRLFSVVLLLAVSACNSISAQQGSASVPETTEKDYEDFNPENFDRSTQIDNIWLPLMPGMQFVYDGETVEDSKKIPHRIVITVTDLTKVIGGVRSVVTWDRDYSDDELVEAELAFFAQDNDGNVWRMGEYPEEYENGEFVIAPSWMHGLQDARAGIAMQANPQVGTPSYSQGWGPAVDWTDRGQVDEIIQEKTCVPVNCYEDVLVIAETSKSEPGAIQLKFYTSGIGNIRTDWEGEDQTKETLVLTEVVNLSPEDMDEARMEALKLEAHAYEVSTDMYVHTAPAEYPLGTPAIQVQAIPIKADVVPQGNTSIPLESLDEIVVYAADLPAHALFELEIWDDPASPGGKLIGIQNTGDELDPPPENDPHATFNIQVQGDTPYRCWIHMKVGAPMGKSQANVIWAQFSGAVDEANQEIFKPDSESYLTAQGPTQEGWAWVRCDLAGSESLIRFQTSGEITVRLQAGMEGVGFDQFILSSAEFLEKPPSQTVVEK